MAVAPSVMCRNELMNTNELEVVVKSERNLHRSTHMDHIESYKP